MTTVINFKEQIILTIQERSNAPFHSGCKMFNWSSNDNPIKVEMILYLKKFLFSILQNFSSIEFDNEYTAFLSIKIKQHAEGKLIPGENTPSISDL